MTAPHTHAKIKRRFEQALWYAYGQIDANDSNLINPTEFAQYCEDQAVLYYTEVTSHLPSIMDQWEAYNT